MIYIDAGALLKFVKTETETAALRTWRHSLSENTELVTSELAQLEITRTLRRDGVDSERVRYFVDQTIRGVYLVDLTSAVLARAMSYQIIQLGSLDSVHLASADPFRSELTDFVTYDNQLGSAATNLGFPVTAPV